MANKSDNSWIEKSVNYPKCPRCPSGLLDTRIPRGFIVKNLFFWIDVKHYKCNNCGAKVYLRNKPQVSGV